MESTELSKKMRERADADALPFMHPLRTRADEFDAATSGYHADPPTKDVKQFMGAWARARRAWCDYTGEELI